MENDVICTEILRDERLHLDEKGYFSTPMLITLDGSQYELRSIIRNIDKYAEWLVYTPQRAIERLSLVNFKITSEALKDGVLATISDEYFFKENNTSLIDTLSLLIDGTSKGEAEIIKLVTSLNRKLTNESINQNEIDIEKYNNISYVLLYTHKEFKHSFEKLIEIFSNDKYKERLTELLINTIKGNFGHKEKEFYSKELTKILEIA